MNEIATSLARPAEAAAKVALLQHLRACGALRHASVVSELIVGRQANRADIVVIDRLLRCFEVKSSKDNLNRIDQQVAAYSRTFDEVTVVAASCHMNAVMSRVPEFVGLSEIMPSSRGLKVRPIRVASRCPMLAVSALLDLLPVAELKALTGPGAARTKRQDLVTAASELDLDTIREAVRRFLRSRYKTATNAFNDATAGRPISPIDLSRLRVWSRSTRSIATVIEDRCRQYDDDLQIYDHVGRSFSAMPDDVRALMERFNQTKALQPA